MLRTPLGKYGSKRNLAFNIETGGAGEGPSEKLWLSFMTGGRLFPLHDGRSGRNFLSYYPSLLSIFSPGPTWSDLPMTSELQRASPSQVALYAVWFQLVLGHAPTWSLTHLHLHTGR